MDQLDFTTGPGGKIAGPLAFTQIGFHNKAAFLLGFWLLVFLFQADPKEGQEYILKG